MANITSIEINNKKMTSGLVPNLEEKQELNLDTQASNAGGNNFWGKEFTMPFLGFVEFYLKNNANSTSRMQISFKTQKSDGSYTDYVNYARNYSPNGGSNFTSPLIPKDAIVFLQAITSNASLESFQCYLYPVKGI